MVWKLNMFDTDEPIRVALEKDSLDVWINGAKIETESGFTDEGSEMTFEVNGKLARIIGEECFPGLQCSHYIVNVRT